MPFNYDAPKTFFEKYARAVNRFVEEIVRQKDWRSLIALLESSRPAVLLLALDFTLFLAFSPVELPFPNLPALFPQLKQSGWYAPVFWSLIALVFINALIVAAAAERETTEHKQGAIKGLAPFGYEDAEIFSRLQREESLKELLQAIGDEQWRFGALSGESGVGKTSFLQAGLWPELEKRGFRCVYVKFSDLDPFESVKRACLKHLSFADEEPDGADFQGLLRAAAAQDLTPVVMFFDQFEQFFVHRKRKKDREPFTQALAQWFAETQSPPIKILICIRGVFFDRLNEMQRAMRYSLGPAQSFRLERFEPDQAAEIFCFLAEKGGLEYDREFISDMTRHELTGADEGLISPVEIQVLARMIERRTAQEGRAFNRATLQKIGGARVLLELYLVTALEPLITRSSRRAAFNILLALTDLEHDARAGALTFEDLRQKLGGDITDSELKDVVACLLHSDLRLISPAPEYEEEKFELAHERLILEVRDLAGEQAGEADIANLRLDYRTNLWLGNGRASRLLFSWSELRQIKKHRRFDASGERRQEKEKFLAASRRRFRLRGAAVSLLVLLILSAQIGWRSNAWQTHLIKEYLYRQGFRLNDVEASIEIATALAYAGDSQKALRVIDQIDNYYSKADAMEKIAESYIGLGDKDKSGALLSDMIKMAERIDNDSGRAYALRKVAESYVKLGDNGKAKSLLSEVIKVAERISNGQHKSFALSEIAASYAGLGGAMKDRDMLKEAVKIADSISDDKSKNYALRAIAASYSRFGVTMEDGALLKEAVKMAERISDKRFKSGALSEIARSYAGMKDRAMLKEAVKIAERISDDQSKSDSLTAIVRSYARLGDKERARAVLEDAIRMAERISDDRSRARALNLISTSYAGLGQAMKDRAMLKKAVEIADRIRINDTYSKPSARSAIARSYAQFGEAMEDRSLLEEAVKISERAGDNRSQALEIVAIADSYARLGDKERACALLKDALRTVELISDDQNKTNALSMLARSYARIGEAMKDRALLEEAVKIADRIGDDRSESAALSAIADSYARLGEATKDRALLEEAVKIADRIGDDRSESYALMAIADSYARFGDKERARALLEDAIEKAAWIDSENKASALSAIVMSYAKLAESSNDSALLYDVARRLIRRPQPDSDRNQLLDAILSSKLAVTNVGRLRLLIAHYDSEVEKTSALARILTACSHPELIENNRSAAPPARPRFPRH